jgi:hypothetical protein
LALKVPGELVATETSSKEELTEIRKNSGSGFEATSADVSSLRVSGYVRTVRYGLLQQLGRGGTLTPQREKS